MKKKTCPIKQDEGDKTYDCHEESCAWWNEGFGQCSVAAIARTLTMPIIAKEMYE